MIGLTDAYSVQRSGRRGQMSRRGGDGELLFGSARSVERAEAVPGGETPTTGSLGEVR